MNPHDMSDYVCHVAVLKTLQKLRWQAAFENFAPHGSRKYLHSISSFKHSNPKRKTYSSIQTPKRKTLLRTPGSQIRSRCAAHAEAASVCFPRAEMHCRAAFPQMVRVKANERVSLAQWKVGEAIATGLFFLLTGPMLLQYMFTLFWSKSLRSVQEWHLGRLS